MPNRLRNQGRPVVAFEEQIRLLAGCGIELLPTVEPAALLRSFSREEYEEDGFQLLLSTMGEATEVSPAGKSGYPSDDIWLFDLECIEDHGDYAAIARRLATLAKGALPLEAVEDHVNVEDGEAWLSFTLDGEAYKWDATVDDDWADVKILSRFADLLVSRGTNRRFTYIDLGGQDCLIGGATPEQRDALQALTDHKVEWLK